MYDGLYGALIGCGMSDLFISYSLSNESIAEAARSHLENRGVKCWKAPRDILPGQNWAEAIVMAISKCQVFLLILTDRSQQSEQVAKELALATEFKKTIIPLRIDECNPKGAFAYHLSGIHWHQASSTDLSSSLDSLCRRIGQVLNIEPVIPKSQAHPEPAMVDQLDSASTGTSLIDELLIMAVREQLSFLIPTTSRAGAQALFDDIGAHELGANTCYLVVNLSVSMKSYKRAMLCFCSSCLVLYLNGDSPFRIERDSLVATSEGDQRLRIQDFLLITKTLSKEDLQRVALGINMWACDYIKKEDGLLVAASRMMKVLLPEYDRFANYYPEVGTMAVIDDLLEEMGHLRVEPPSLGEPAVEYGLDPSAIQSVYLYRKWIELHDGAGLKTSFVPFTSHLYCYARDNELRIEHDGGQCSMLTKQKEIADAFVKVIRSWMDVRRSLGELGLGVD